MPNRILRDGILGSSRVDKLSYEAEVFYRRLMSIADDYGRNEADTVIIRAKCYPRRTDKITLQQIEQWLQETAEAELVVVYTVKGKRYFQITDFNQRQRTDSKYPDPASADICGQMRANDSKCPQMRANDGLVGGVFGDGGVGEVVVEGEVGGVYVPLPRYPNQNPGPGEFDYQKGFRELWDAYPSKGRTKRIDSERMYVEAVSPDPWRLHDALMAPILPGGKWEQSASWRKGFVFSLFEYIRNRRDLEDPEPFDPNKGGGKPKGAGTSMLERLAAGEDPQKVYADFGVRP